jgi:AraC-like DNA-binding protein/mannose-6-phosphate isomerase-like protein (cupin superfamily)
MFESCSLAIAHAGENKSFAGYYSEASNPDPDIHIHNCCEIFFCLSGGKNFLIGGQLYDVSDNDIFVINQYEAHKITYTEDESFRRYVFQISPEFLHDCSTRDTDLSKGFYPHKHGFDHRVHLSDGEAAKLLEHLEVLGKDNGYGDDLIKRGIMTEILVNINKAIIEREGEDSRSRSHTAVNLAIDYINKNYSDQLTLESVAKACYLSVNQLCRLFSEHCGTTVAKYITSKRITEAKKMLAAGKGVTETAMLCGFGDYSGFIRVFKKNVGVTPGKYKGDEKDKR